MTFLKLLSIGITMISKPNEDNVLLQFRKKDNFVEMSITPYELSEYTNRELERYENCICKEVLYKFGQLFHGLDMEINKLYEECFRYQG